LICLGSGLWLLAIALNRAFTNIFFSSLSVNPF
jgi:hypothetical protein